MCAQPNKIVALYKACEPPLNVKLGAIIEVYLKAKSGFSSLQKVQALLTL